MKSSLAFSLLTMSAALRADEGAMHEAFNELTQFATRLPLVKFPADHWKAITDCMQTAGDTLYPTASDAAWTGWTQFGINGGTPNDPWRINNTAGWMEYDPRNMTHKGQKIPIIEPCNTISNLAYYRIVPDLCGKRQELTMDDDYINALIQSFATLGMGSSFMHGSRTALGGTFDNTPIAVIAYQYFQYMNTALTADSATDKSVLHELSKTARAYDGRELARRLHTIPLEFELENWNDALHQLDSEDYFVTFAAIIINGLTLIAPDFINDQLIPLLMDIFALGDDVKEFIVNTYVPVIRAANSGFNLSLQEKAALVPKALGTVLKLLWAFTWQEGIFKYPFLYNAEWNVFGALLIPSVNNLANKWTGFAHPDDTIQKSESVYPGQEWCKVKNTAPHAKWHEISANGLMDLGYLADHIKVVIDGALPRQEPRVQSDGYDVVFATEDIKEWVSDLHSEDWSEGYVVRQAFAQVITDVVTDMDSCASGTADGHVTWNDLTCYLTGLDSAESFVARIFYGISGHQKQALAQVHSTPNQKPVFV